MSSIRFVIFFLARHIAGPCSFLDFVGHPNLSFKLAASCEHAGFPYGRELYQEVMRAPG